MTSPRRLRLPLVLATMATAAAVVARAADPRSRALRKAAAPDRPSPYAAVAARTGP